MAQYRDPALPRSRHPCRESGVVMLLDKDGRSLGRIGFDGSANRLHLPWRTILRCALEIPCRGLVLIHYHPSQNPCPSAADVQVTRAMVHMLRPLDIMLCDHVIVTDHRHYSFREQGLL